jgi:NAD(P)-dependent dehydrogenase (short-subunit alcohol dehydrogenase family)
MTTWLITGCSSGLGKALAAAVLAHGHQVIATARDVSAVQHFSDAHPDRVLAAPLDVTDAQQIAAVVASGEARFGGIDVLVNNAGYGYRAAVEEGDPDEVRQLFATNLHAPVAMMAAVLPGMRGRRSGAIVNISSIGARAMPPGSGFYAASKAALEAVSGSLRKELRPLGISVTSVEPGSFRTDFAGRSLTESSTVLADYAETAGARRKASDTSHGTQPGDPAKAALAVIAAVEADDPPELLLLGTDAVSLFRTAVESQLAEAAAWQHLSLSTDIDE